MKEMIKLLIFDLSNVCFNVEELPFLRKFAAEHDLNYDQLDQFYQELLAKSEVDEISGEVVWQEVLKKYGIKSEAKKLIKEMIAGKEAFPETLELVKKLKKNYKTAYLTNYNKDYWDLISERFDLSTYFDFGAVSYQIKARKPAAKGFLVILRHFGVKPEEAVFIDDSEKNLNEPKRLGIKTIWFKNKERLITNLREFGVKP